MTNTIAALTALSALGHPSRRAIFGRLAQAPACVGEVAATLPVSRAAVSQHLRVLKDAGLVTETRVGARRVYQLDPQGLAVVREWLDSQGAAPTVAFRES